MSSPIPHPPSPISTSFPSTRLRRLRRAPFLREMVAQTRLHVSDLIWPIFIEEGLGVETAITSLPGVTRMSVDVAIERAKEAHALGIPAIALFPKIDAGKKDERGTEAINPDGLVPRAIKQFKAALPELGIIADVALDPYTSHGQDGIVENNIIVNDATVDMLCEQAATLAEAGADIVAPSDMMDGRIGAIRTVLELAGFKDTIILSYAAKYASHMYGPFREAVGSAPSHPSSLTPHPYLDKRTYQMDFRNACEAMREIAMDIAEGADMVMVKPGIAYLDIVAKAASSFDVPILAYQVSGEYAMIKAASEKGFIDGDTVMLEHLIAMKRAGAKAILTYAAVEVAKKLT